MSITAIILTYNEAIHLERAIRSIQPFARQILVPRPRLRECAVPDADLIIVP